MKLPFTLEQFLNLFAEYNQDIFPLQIIFYVLAITAMILIFRKTRYSGQLISLILALFWLWMGIVYHWLYFKPMNKAATFFGAAFVLQGIFFLIEGVWRKRLSFQFRNNYRGVFGIIFILVGLIIYPALSHFNGHIYPNTPSLGLPCPTTIMTFGFLCMAQYKFPISMMLIPLFWALIGTSAAFILGMKEDYILLATGMISYLLVSSKKKIQESLT